MLPAPNHLNSNRHPLRLALAAINGLLHSFRSPNSEPEFRSQCSASRPDCRGPILRFAGPRQPEPSPSGGLPAKGWPTGTERRSDRTSRAALFAAIRRSSPFTISDLAPRARKTLGGSSYPRSKRKGTLRYIYYKHLDKRITALEKAWAWATPRTFGWVDSKGNIEIVSENRAARRLRERAERLDPQLKLDFDPQPASSKATPAPAVQPWLPGLDPVSCAEAAEFTAEFAASANARVCPPIFEPPGQMRSNPDTAAGPDSGASRRKSTAYARSARAQSGPNPAFFRNPDIRGHFRTGKIKSDQKGQTQDSRGTSSATAMPSLTPAAYDAAVISWRKKARLAVASRASDPTPSIEIRPWKRIFFKSLKNSP